MALCRTCPFGEACNKYPRSLSQSRSSLSLPLPRSVIFLIVKQRRGFSQLSFVYVLFSFNIVLIAYFRVVLSIEPLLDHNIKLSSMVATICRNQFHFNETCTNKNQSICKWLKLEVSGEIGSSFFHCSNQTGL